MITNVKSVDLPDNSRLSGYKGERIIERISKDADYFEAELLRRWLPGNRHFHIVYDIGANLGNHTVYFSRYANAQTVFAFEPMPQTYKMLTKNIRNNALYNVTPYPLALGDRQGHVEMSFAIENDSGSASIVNDSVKDSVSVEITDMDSLLLPLPDFIKIDVTGFELSVLKGMRDVLEKGSPFIWIEMDTANAPSVYQLLSQLGYSIQDLLLKEGNHILFAKGVKSKFSDAQIFQHLLIEASQKREHWTTLGKQHSQFQFEQSKANNLLKDLESMTSKFQYEQQKAAQLGSQLGSEVSKFEYEQQKARQFAEQVGVLQSKLDTLQEDQKAFSERVQSLTLLVQSEQHRADDLNDQLTAMTSSFQAELARSALFTEQIQYSQTVIAHLEASLEKQRTEHIRIKETNLQELTEVKSELSKKQQELDMLNNSRMIKFVRFWIWHVPTRMKRRIRRSIYNLAHMVYVRLMPYPRMRAFFSRVNGKLKIIKNPTEVVSPRLKANRSNPGLPSRQEEIKLPHQMNVAMIADEFSYNSFRYECNAFPLEPGNWKDIFSNHAIDLFFCESAWAGADTANRPWRGQIYSSINFARENRTILFEILDYCKQRGIPTVFWNKEDPTHYEDKVHNFVDTALKFDHIFTTSVECVDRYKQDYGHPSVHLMMFATQPALFNPIEKFERTEEVIFAGSWYNQHPTRCQEMGAILDRVAESPYGLKIYNRHYGDSDPNHQFPERFSPYINPALSHDDLDQAYKGSQYALNINTVTESKTMFARRVFELMSSNTLVISNYSEGMHSLFGDSVVFTDGSSPLDLSNSIKLREDCLYTVLKHHTYRNRFQQLLDDIGIQTRMELPTVVVVYNVSGVDDLPGILSHFHTVSWMQKVAVIVVSKDCPGHIFNQIMINYHGSFFQVVSESALNLVHLCESNDYKYAVLNAHLSSSDFVEKAFVHYSYLDENVCIASHSDSGRAFTFGNCLPGASILCPAISLGPAGIDQNACCYFI